MEIIVQLGDIGIDILHTTSHLTQVTNSVSDSAYAQVKTLERISYIMIILHVMPVWQYFYMLGVE